MKKKAKQKEKMSRENKIIIISALIFIISIITLFITVFFYNQIMLSKNSLCIPVEAVKTPAPK